MGLIMVFFSNLPFNKEAEIVWISPDVQMRLAGSPLRYHAKITKVDTDKLICDGEGYDINGLEQSIGVQIVKKND